MGLLNQRCIRLHASIVICDNQCDQLGDVDHIRSKIVEVLAEGQVYQVEHQERNADKNGKQ